MGKFRKKIAKQIVKREKEQCSFCEDYDLESEEPKSRQDILLDILSREPYEMKTKTESREYCPMCGRKLGD